MLILTEKPSVAKDFAKALSCAFSDGVYKNAATTIVNCVGHLFELEEPAHYGTELPIIPNKFDYRAKGETAEQAKLVVRTLQLHKRDSILIATDADREGEVIARECLAQAGITDFSRAKRFWVSEALTPEVIKSGMKAARPLSDYDGLAEQGFARQKADWLVGMNFSRWISAAANQRLSVGRVQTAILSAISQRCEEIRNFKSEKYFEHWGTFKVPRGTLNSACKGIYFEKSADSEAEATSFSDETRKEKLQACAGKKAALADSKSERRVQNPPQLYNLNALQKEAYKHFEYTAKKTLEIVQSLYEDLKCSSYPRTPSRVMGSGNVDLCQKIADELCISNPEYESRRSEMDISLSNKRCFNDAKLEAHHAIIPLKALPKEATVEQANVYGLILDRFFEAFLAPCEYEKQVFVLDVDFKKFRVEGKKVIKAGWQKWSKPQAEDKADDGEQEQSLDGIDWNDLVLSEVETKEKWTKAPPHFNEASILSFMENPKKCHVALGQNDDSEQKRLAGLGTAATRHTFIPKLTKKGYIELQRKNFVTTQLGEALLKAVRGSSIKSLADIDETTHWEQNLSENPSKFFEEIKEFVLAGVSSQAKVDAPPQGSTGIACPVCGKEIRKGKSNWYCSGYKEGCQFKIWETIAGAKITEKDAAALCIRKKTGLKHCVSKAGKPFDCKFELDENSQIRFLFEGK